MNSKQLKLVPIGLMLAFGSGQALAESGWYHDSNTGALVINAEGSRSKFSSSNIATEDTLSPMQSWYHDEDSDTIVYNMEGSRSGYKGASSSM